MKVTDYIVEFLQRKGIHDFFGYQGTMIAHLVDSIEKNPHTRMILCNYDSPLFITLKHVSLTFCQTDAVTFSIIAIDLFCQLLF